MHDWTAKRGKMKQADSKKSWTPPKLEQLPMADTAIKGSDQSESVNTNMFMTATGMQS